jgi:hypothetical protein
MIDYRASWTYAPLTLKKFERLRSFFLFCERAKSGCGDESSFEAIGTARAQDIAIETLGRDRPIEILQEVADYVKQQSKVGMVVNERVEPLR